MTLGQLKSKVYNHLREDNPDDVVTNPNTHFTDASIITGYLNEAAEFAAVFIEYQRTLVNVQTQSNVGSYPNPVDNLFVRTVYFGDSSIPGDIRPLETTIEETLKTKYPSWLDNTSTGTADRPQYWMQLDRLTIHIFPRPNAIGSASGKKIWLNYNYNPAAMSNNSDIPDLPLPYHNLLPLYALHLCYIDLEKPPLADEMYKLFMDKVMKLKSAVTIEAKENLGFSWGADIDVDIPPANNILFP